VVRATAGGDRRRMAVPSAIGRHGPLGRVSGAGTATAPIENIWCEKNRGCICRRSLGCVRIPVISDRLGLTTFDLAQRSAPAAMLVM
jgi:hypothetical protein